MTIEMVYLNPNITTEQADKMVAEVNVKRGDLVDRIIDNAQKLPPEQRIKYISSVLPMVMMFL